MKKKFSVKEAMQYCEERKANVLMSEINWLKEDAVFKLFNISEDLWIHYLEDSVEDEDHNFILPGDLQVRNIDYVWLDTSEVEFVSGEYKDLY